MARIRERPILIYHQIGVYPPDQMAYGVTPAAFRSHLDVVDEQKLEVISLGEMVAQMKGEAPASPRAISLTFDGGFRDAAENAVPILAERGLKAAFFIPTEFVGKEHSISGAKLPCMDWPGIRGLVDAGMTVGSLGRYGARLYELGESKWREDARAARETLEDKLGFRLSTMPTVRHFQTGGCGDGLSRRVSRPYLRCARRFAGPTFTAWGGYRWTTRRPMSFKRSRRIHISSSRISDLGG